jgi:hypothetical protein
LANASVIDEIREDAVDTSAVGGVCRTVARDSPAFKFIRVKSILTGDTLSDMR